jgi:protein O-mannosyl-transferase
MRATDRTWMALLVAAAVLPYLNTLGNGFAFDDRGMIFENAAVRSATTQPSSFFTTPFYPGALYRPLSFLSYWVEQRLHGMTPFGFHLVNLGMHTLVTLLVFALCRSLRLGGLVSFLAAGLFAVHPIHTEAVSNIIGRTELFSAAAVLGALLCAARAGQNRAWVAAGAALFALGLLSKESAFVLVPLLFVCEWMRQPRPLVQVLATLTSSGALPVYGAVAAAYLGLRWWLFGTLTVGEAVAWLDNPLAHSSTMVRLGTATMVFVDSLAQMILPLRLSADYSFDQIPLVTSPFDPRFLIAAAVLSALALVVWRTRAEAPVLLGCVAFYLAAVSLTANLLFPIGTIRAERLLYLPSVGFCILVGVGAGVALERRPRWAATALAVVFVAFAGRTWARNPDWSSDITLFRATVNASPNSAKAHHNLGAALAEAKQRPEDASMAFRQALQIWPDYEEAAFGVGTTYEARGLNDGAMHWYGETLRINPHHVRAYINRGNILYRIGDFGGAEAEFQRGLVLLPDEPRLLTGIGIVRLAEGRFDEARALLEQSLQLAPDYAVTRDALDYAQQTNDPMKGS